MNLIDNANTEIPVLFGKEIKILEDAQGRVARGDLSNPKLADHFRRLCVEYGKILKVAARITRLSDSYQKKLLEANERIEAQRAALEKANRRQEKLLEELRQLNATKDKFFSIVAHDIRGAFASFKSGFDLLSDYTDDLDKDEIREIALHLKKSGANLYELLENLLQWSRLRMGGMKIQPENLRLAATVNDVFRLMGQAARKKGIDLESVVGEEVAVLADAPMLFSLLQNLVANAIKFSKRGGRVLVGARRSRSKVIVSVADDGVGMDQEQIADLFRIDRQSSRPGTAGEQGTGLGLILCKEFVEKNGGEIKVESSPGCGAKVFFSLWPARE